jgi:hypothetical protein
MGTLVKNLSDSRQVIFDTGGFDDWCVYILESNGYRKAPRDIEYFADFQQISNHYPQDKVYQDFIAIYDRTTNEISPKTLDTIDERVNTYQPEHQKLMEQWLSVIYAGMIAEENKAGTKLKKRVKRLGMYQVLVLKMNPTEAASFSKGKTWRELDAIMKGYDF